MSLIERLRAARRSALETVTFCDACGQVCDAACRAAAFRSQARDNGYPLRRI